MSALPETLRTFEIAPGRTGRLHSLPALEEAGLGAISRLPVSIRIVLESLVRHRDGRRVRDEDVLRLCRWQPNGERTEEVPFVVARVLLQDFTGVPLIVDLAAMRAAAARLGRSPRSIEPVVPVELVVDHSVQVDYYARPDAIGLNEDIEMRRNRPRYELLKWGAQAFERLRIVPPGVGICHQVNLEYLGRGVIEKDGVTYPDTLVGTDSHTTMINGLGVVGWGVGGIEAEAGMLGQPVYFLQPDVVGVHLSGSLSPGATATDLVLRITELLRKTNVVGKFVEFFGEGAASLPAAERATIGNMAPEYGATIGFFPVDEETCRYFLMTGRPPELVDAMRAYYRAQGLFGMPAPGQCDYTQVVELDLSTVVPAVSGPKRPQDLVPLTKVRDRWRELFTAPPPGGYGRPAAELDRRFPARVGLGDGEPALTVSGGGDQSFARWPERWTEEEMMNNRPTPDAVEARASERSPREVELGHGAVLIAAITSCTNTSNPSVMLGAGILAKKAVERGLRVPPWVKTSLAPGSRAVTEYYRKLGLKDALDALGFHLVGHGCTTCIGNSGPLDPHLEEAIATHDLVAASVLSGNRNFEARVHGSLRANFLMSPPLVVAYALAGRIDVDLDREPIGRDREGRDVYLRDLWPTAEEVRAAMAQAGDPETYRRLYTGVTGPGVNRRWDEIPSPTGESFAWDPASTYVREPPYFVDGGGAHRRIEDVRGARVLAIFGDSITTDHISPAGSIEATSPAGQYLLAQGVAEKDFNSYGARRGNHEVMVRGTFANVRLKNQMVPGVEGGVTIHQPSGQRLSIYDAAVRYAAEGVPLVILAGREYGTGSSRDWAAKGTRLLGVRAVIATSFERIHCSNLVGMGVLPCELEPGVDAGALGLDGSESYDLVGLEPELAPRQAATLVVRRPDGREDRVRVRVRVDTPIEVEYLRHGGILPYVLAQVVARG